MNNVTNIVEAIIFASGKSISKKDISDRIDDITYEEVQMAISELKEKYSGKSGIRLLTFNDKVQFSTNADYGEEVLTVLTPLREKELSGKLLETLAIIAYKQPITRSEIEEIRGVDSDYPITMLSKLNLITLVGRKDTVGRPALYGTTEEFLKRFNINSLDDLPDKEELYEKIRILDLSYNKMTDSLYREVNVTNDDFSTDNIDSEQNKNSENDNKTPIEKEIENKELQNKINESEEEFMESFGDEKFEIIE